MGVERFELCVGLSEPQNWACRVVACFGAPIGRYYDSLHVQPNDDHAWGLGGVLKSDPLSSGAPSQTIRPQTLNPKP